MLAFGAKPTGQLLTDMAWPEFLLPQPGSGSRWHLPQAWEDARTEIPKWIVDQCDRPGPRCYCQIPVTPACFSKNEAVSLGDAGPYGGNDASAFPECIHHRRQWVGPVPGLGHGGWHQDCRDHSIAAGGARHCR